LNDSAEVYAKAIQVVDEFSAIITLLWPSPKRPSVGKVYRQDDDSKRQGYLFASMNAVIVAPKMRVRATVVVDGEPQEQQGPTQAQQLLVAPRADRHLQAAILLWALMAASSRGT
jgi:hypothetical protein